VTRRLGDRASGTQPEWHPGRLQPGVREEYKFIAGMITAVKGYDSPPHGLGGQRTGSFPGPSPSLIIVTMGRRNLNFKRSFGLSSCRTYLQCCKKSESFRHWLLYCHRGPRRHHDPPRQAPATRPAGRALWTSRIARGPGATAPGVIGPGATGAADATGAPGATGVPGVPRTTRYNHKCNSGATGTFFCPTKV
jgi:hypothetical protein